MNHGNPDRAGWPRPQWLRCGEYRTQEILMIAFQVTNGAGQVLAIFRHEGHAREYLEAHKDRPEPVLCAVEVVPVRMSETIWDRWFTPLTEGKPPSQ